MKAILEFELPEDKMAHLRAVHADNLVFMIWELDQWLRDRIKYEDRIEFQPVREQLYSILEEHGLFLDELID